MKRDRIIGVICGLLVLNVIIEGAILFSSHRGQIASSPPAPIQFSTPAPPPPKPIQTPPIEDKGIKGKLEKILTDAKAKAATVYTQGVKDDAQEKAAAYEQQLDNMVENARKTYAQSVRSPAQAAATPQAQAADAPQNAAPSLTAEQQARYRKAQADLAMASREDQLRAAMIQKYYQENGPYTSAQFRFLDEETKWAVITYVPWALPPEMQGTSVQTIYVH